MRTGSLKKSNFECHRQFHILLKSELHWLLLSLLLNFCHFEGIVLLISPLLPQKEAAPLPRFELSISHRFIPLLHLKV